MKIEKKHIVAASISLVTISGALLYLQYRKMMDYVITVKGAIVNSISLNLIDFTLNLNFQNKSTIGFIIESQSYDVYINDLIAAKLNNNTPVKIDPKSVSLLPLRVKLNPTQSLKNVQLNIANILLKPESVILKVVAKLKVKLWFFTVNIPYTYRTSIKDLTKKN
jgi:LEA14-like dessication related protein